MFDELCLIDDEVVARNALTEIYNKKRTHEVLGHHLGGSVWNELVREIGSENKAAEFCFKSHAQLGGTSPFATALSGRKGQESVKQLVQSLNIGFN